MTLPQHAELFTQTICWQQQRIVLTVAPRLRQSLEQRWDSIVATNPEITGERELLDLLVKDLFTQLPNSSPHSIVHQHWLSFAKHLALKVAGRIAKITSDRQEDLEEIQGICLAAIVRLDRLFAGFKLQSNIQNDLLGNLRAYTYKAIQYSVYPEIRKTFNNPNIGRSLLGLFNRYSDRVIRSALAANNVAPTQIERDLHLCKCAREYLRQTGQRINQLQTTDFDLIGDLYLKVIGDLPPPPHQQLTEIGRAILHFTTPPTISTNSPILYNSTVGTSTIEDTLESDRIRPEIYVEMQELDDQWQKILHLCDRWLIENPDPYERNILLLRYGFNLKQTPIGYILGKDQSNICLRLRQVHQRLASTILQAIAPNKNTPNPMSIELVIILLSNNFKQLSIYSQIDFTTLQELNSSIGEVQMQLTTKESRCRPSTVTAIECLQKTLTSLWHQ